MSVDTWTSWTPYAYDDPSAPTLGEATATLGAANWWRAKYEEACAAAKYQQGRAEGLEAELSGARETAEEAEREANEMWAA